MVFYTVVSFGNCYVFSQIPPITRKLRTDNYYVIIYIISARGIRLRRADDRWGAKSKLHMVWRNIKFYYLLAVSDFCLVAGYGPKKSVAEH